MRVSILQTSVTRDKQNDIERAAARVRAAGRRGAELIMLPEMFCCPYATKHFAAYGESHGGAAQRAMSEAARAAKAYLIAGSVPELDGGKVFNTAFVYAPDGRQIARHRKIHLFDIDVVGGIRFMESDVLSPGERPTVFDTPYGRIGVCICFDMRFPALFRDMTDLGAVAVAIPGAFNMTTGPLHWELLLRARAVDNQLYTLAAAPARQVDGEYVSYAHSLICNPWGKVVADAGEGDADIDETLDMELPMQVRRQIPLGLA